jgi:phosphatidate cytidylyltransferase
MRLRVLTALVLIPPVLYLILWSPQWLFIAAVLIVVLRTEFEYFELSRAAGLSGFRWLGYAGCTALCLAQAVDLRGSPPSATGVMILTLTVLVIPFVLMTALALTRELHEYARDACSTLFGIFYIGLLLSWLVPLRFPSPMLAEAAASAIPPRQILLFLFLVNWAGDIFAYLVGRGLGRILLFPHISPKKTLEGSLGGLAGSLLVAWGLTLWWKTSDWEAPLLLAGLVAIAGQMGDLVESALKRNADLKDSASLLPGHGGLLDRVDSLIFGAPVLWAALTIKGLLVRSAVVELINH